MFFGYFVIFSNILLFSEAIPVYQPFSGHFTYYNDRGTGACGNYLDASSEMLVAVSHEWFTEANPNNDPLCRYCLKIDYKDKSITVPIKDKCPSCLKDHMDLSQPAFSALENLDVGNAYGATFTFVNC